MIQVPLTIEAASDWVPGTRVQVYWDAGSGAVDMDAPLLGAPVPAWRNLAAFNGWLKCGWIGSTWLGAQPNLSGMFDGPWLIDPWCEPVERVTVRVSVPRMDGPVIFESRSVDESGNQSASGTQSRLRIQQRLTGCYNFAFSDWDSTLRVASFTFEVIGE